MCQQSIVMAFNRATEFIYTPLRLGRLNIHRQVNLLRFVLSANARRIVDVSRAAKRCQLAALRLRTGRATLPALSTDLRM